MTTTDTPIFDATAGPHRAHVLDLLTRPVPTAAQIIDAADTAAEEEG